MAAAGYPGEDAALYDTVRAVALELCPALGIAIPVGKDSLSMRTAWRDGRRGEGGRRAALAHRLGVRAGARTRARTLTPQLRTDAGETELRAGRPRARAGTASAARSSRRCIGQLGDAAPDLDDPRGC